METKGAATGYYLYDGPTSIEERIVLADVLARVRLISVDGAVVAEPGDFYYGALEFRFRVLEYIKGSGGSEVVAVAIDEYYYDTEAEARATVSGLVAARDTRWDNSEAIVFLEDYHDQDGRTTYRLGLNTVRRRCIHGGEPAGQEMAAGSANYYFEYVPFDGHCGEAVPAGRAIERGRTGVIVPVRVASRTDRERADHTLSAFKAKVAELEAEVAAGDGSEEYRDCVYSKYSWPRRLRWRAENGPEGPGMTTILAPAFLPEARSTKAAWWGCLPTGSGGTGSKPKMQTSSPWRPSVPRSPTRTLPQTT